MSAIGEIGEIFCGNVTALLFGFIVLLIVLWIVPTVGGNTPPGPLGLPIVGYLPFLKGLTREKALKKLCDKYGSIVSVRLGSLQVIVVGTWDAAKEILVKQGDNFSGKPKQNKFKYKAGDAGLRYIEGEKYKEHRRFILSTFRDFGWGKLSLEPKIMEEVRYFLKVVEEQENKPIDLSELLGISIANVLSAMEFGQRFDHNDPELKRMRSLLVEGAKYLSAVGIRLSFPWTRFIPYIDKITGALEFKKIISEFDKFIHDKVVKHEKTYEKGSRRDFIDAYFTERLNTIEKTGNEGHFNLADMEGDMSVLFGAGSETTAVSIRWGLLYLMRNPDVYRRIQKEIDDVIGLERKPSIMDRAQMPYTEAVILEVQRCASPVPLSVVHCNMFETTVLGYRIPKRSYVVCNFWAIHHDPALWGDPDVFRPERFLDENSKLQKPDYLIPFGTGRRMCIGESLARMELFLYYTSMLQRFEFRPPEGAILSLDYDFGITRAPKPFNVCAIAREGYHVA